MRLLPVWEIVKLKTQPPCDALHLREASGLFAHSGLSQASSREGHVQALALSKIRTGYLVCGR